MKGLIQGRTFQSDRAGTHPNSRSNAPAEKNSVASGFKQPLMVQGQICQDSHSALWSRINSVLDVILQKEAVIVQQPMRPLKICSLLDFPLPYSRKTLGKKLKPWYKRH